MKYCTDDGKRVFDTEQEVFDYEKKVKAEKEERAKRLKDKEARKDEIKAIYQNLIEKAKQYNEDYNESLAFTTNSPINGIFTSPFNGLFNALMHL